MRGELHSTEFEDTGHALAEPARAGQQVWQTIRAVEAHLEASPESAMVDQHARAARETGMPVYRIPLRNLWHERISSAGKHTHVAFYPHHDVLVILEKLSWIRLMATVMELDQWLSSREKPS